MKKYILGFFGGLVVGGGLLSLLFFFPFGLSLIAIIAIFITATIFSGVMGTFLVWLGTKIFSPPDDIVRVGQKTFAPVGTHPVKKEEKETKNKLNTEPVLVEKKEREITAKEIADRLAERESTVEWLRANIIC